MTASSSSDVCSKEGDNHADNNERAALHDHDVKIPQDIAIVSIDNIDISKMIRPSLTTVDVPKRRMASYAMQVLVLQDQFKDQKAASTVVPTELIIRESCGANL